MSKTKISEQVSKWEISRLFETEIVAEEELLSDDELRQIAQAEGRKQGYQDGLQQGLEDIQQRADKIDAIINALTQPFNDQSNQLVEEIAFLAGKIAKNLVRRELKTEPEIIMGLVRDTIATLNTSSHKIDIYLHPEDAKIIRKIIDADTPEQKWQIIDDPIINRGDCKVLSNNSLIDTDLHNRVNLIIIQCLGDERKEKSNDS